MEQKSLLTYGIKGKLVSAICMLLVAAIMVVSSTYAWFTLSTHPEVTGISTTIGANGALEMALVTTTGTGSGRVFSYGKEGIANTNVKEHNGIWGNLVTLTDEGEDLYGLDLITLYPSLLKSTNSTDGLNTPLTFQNGFILAKPTYNASGRVESADSTAGPASLGADEDAFYPDDNYLGVRAVGAASGLTERQLAYKNAKAAAARYKSQAQNAAATSLTDNGPTLASIAVKHAMSDGADTYTQEDVDSLKTIVSSILGTNGVLDYIEKAYIEYIVAYSASAEIGTDDAAEIAYLAVRGLAEGKTFSQFIDALDGFETDGGITVSIPATILGPINSLIATRTTVESVQTKLAGEAYNKGASYSYSWTEISDILTDLANPSEMLVNGYTISEVKSNMDALFNDVSSGKGITVSVPTGGGVYADVADHCGDYDAKVQIEEIKVGGITMKNANATMKTATTVNPAYLMVAEANIGTEPAAAAAAKLPVSEFYGYILDLAFRTNAVGSNLLLQTEEADRIYSDNTNDETMGGGSVMKFKSLSGDFSNKDILNLIENFRIVFFTPATGDTGECDILATAKLDVDNAKITAEGVETPIVICENRYAYARNCKFTYDAIEIDKDGNEVEVNNKEAQFTQYVYSKTTTEGEGDSAVTTTTYYTDYKCEKGQIANIAASDDAYLAAIKANLPDDAKPGTDVSIVAGSYSCDTTSQVVASTVLSGSDAVITALNQNVATPVSVLVYLDGETITNADVAAQAVSSVTGTMNLQFASSAELVPMDYSDLHISEQVNVTAPADLPADVTFAGGNATPKNRAYTFSLSGEGFDHEAYEVSYTIKGTDTPVILDNDGDNYTIPKEKVTGDITISVKAKATGSGT